MVPMEAEMTCARSVRSFLICICSVLFPCSGQPPRGYTLYGPLQGTKTDLIEYYAYHQTVRILVHECMSKNVHSLAPDETIHMIAMLMTSHKISRVVVEKNKKPIGIVTARDFLPVSLIHGTGSLGYWTTRADMILAKRHQRFIPSGMIAVVLAQDIMTSSPVTVSMNTDTAEAARVMIRNRISGLPVINKKGYLVGIITKTDILKNQIVTPIDFGIG